MSLIKECDIRQYFLLNWGILHEIGETANGLPLGN
jgi:hypothetical protein